MSAEVGVALLVVAVATVVWSVFSRRRHARRLAAVLRSGAYAAAPADRGGAQLAALSAFASDPSAVRVPPSDFAVALAAEGLEFWFGPPRAVARAAVIPWARVRAIRVGGSRRARRDRWSLHVDIEGDDGTRATAIVDLGGARGLPSAVGFPTAFELLRQSSGAPDGAAPSRLGPLPVPRGLVAVPGGDRQISAPLVRAGWRPLGLDAAYMRDATAFRSAVALEFGEPGPWRDEWRDFVEGLVAAGDRESAPGVVLTIYSAKRLLEKDGVGERAVLADCLRRAARAWRDGPQPASELLVILTEEAPPLSP